MLYPSAKVARLYDLEKDPLELNDLAEKQGSKEKMKRLFAILRDLQKTYDDSLDLTTTFPGLL